MSMHIHICKDRRIVHIHPIEEMGQNINNRWIWQEDVWVFYVRFLLSLFFSEFEMNFLSRKQTLDMEKTGERQGNLCRTQKSLNWSGWWLKRERKKKTKTWKTQNWKGNSYKTESTFICPEISFFFINHKHLGFEIFVFYGDV